MSLDAHRPLPLMFRVAAGARRALGESGTQRIARSRLATPLRRAMAAGVPDEAQLVAVTGGALKGARLHIELATEKYYWLGTHEPRVQSFLLREVAVGDVAWDIGAHIGFFSVLLCHLVGPSGYVYAFEPAELNVERLQANLDVNGLENGTVCAAAVGDCSGFVDFAPGASSLEGRIAGGEGLRVESVTVDDAVAAGCRPPTFMKIDVEGAEALVIRGARETIAAHRPRMLIEIHSAAAAQETALAMPVPYLYTDLASGRAVPEPVAPGHYVARPAEGGRS